VFSSSFSIAPPPSSKSPASTNSNSNISTGLNTALDFNFSSTSNQGQTIGYVDQVPNTSQNDFSALSFDTFAAPINSTPALLPSSSTNNNDDFFGGFQAAGNTASPTTTTINNTSNISSQQWFDSFSSGFDAPSNNINNNTQISPKQSTNANDLSMFFSWGNKKDFVATYNDGVLFATSSFLDLSKVVTQSQKKKSDPNFAYFFLHYPISIHKMTSFPKDISSAFNRLYNELQAIKVTSILEMSEKMQENPEAIVEILQHASNIEDCELLTKILEKMLHVFDMGNFKNYFCYAICHLITLFLENIDIFLLPRIALYCGSIVEMGANPEVGKRRILLALKLFHLTISK